MSAPDARPSTVTSDAAASRQRWVKTAWASVALATACAMGELAAGPGYRFGWWGLGAGLQTIRWAATVAAVVFALALLASATAQRKRMRRALAIFLVASILSLAAAAPPAYLWFQLQRLPHIHDISTDTENPPHYVSVLPLRQGARNSTEYDTGVARQQRQGYPDIAPAILGVPAPQAFRRAERVARSMGWEIVAAVPGELRIEATATTLLFGFKDDIVIRVTPDGSASRVDLRSLSRVGGSDFGANASRIRAFIKKLESDAAD
jgi:uncharacterized protein (DUF1499 family)